MDPRETLLLNFNSLVCSIAKNDHTKKIPKVDNIDVCCSYKSDVDYC